MARSISESVGVATVTVNNSSISSMADTHPLYDLIAEGSSWWHERQSRRRVICRGMLK